MKWQSRKENLFDLLVKLLAVPYAFRWNGKCLIGSVTKLGFTPKPNGSSQKVLFGNSKSDPEKVKWEQMPTTLFYY
jgi:hypothetical protein